MNDRIARRTRAHWMQVLPALATLFLAGGSGAAYAMTSVLIWPIDPVIESDQHAAALWLENHDTKPVMLQIRVLGWSEANGDEVYDETQERVAGSPPMALVPPGQRQLIRLTRLTDTPSGTEQAYRVLIDEVPQPDNDTRQSADATTLGIHFQMHYSLPLFVDGAGIWTREDPNRHRSAAHATQPVLGWHIEHDGAKRWLVIANRGAVHARLTQIAFETPGRHTDVERGLLGYALPGAQMRWLLSDSLSFSEQSKLVATVNGRAGIVIDPDAADARP